MCFRMFPRLSSTSPRNLYCYMIDLFWLMHLNLKEVKKRCITFVCCNPCIKSGVIIHASLN
jgi:hypothetical protein